MKWVSCLQQVITQSDPLLCHKYPALAGAFLALSLPFPTTNTSTFPVEVFVNSDWYNSMQEGTQYDSSIPR